MTRKPVHRFLPLTYQPKIAGVQEGRITQSIRIDYEGTKRPLQVGDFIGFHGWTAGRYSPWSFRTPYMQLIMATPITFKKNNTVVIRMMGQMELKPDLDSLARLDGIEPATGEELIRVIRSMHGNGALHGKILRWDPTPIKEQRIKEIAPFVIKPDPSQIDELGRIKMCEGDFTRVEQVHATVKETDPLRSPRLTPPQNNFVQLGAFDNAGTNCEGIKDGFVLIRQKQGVR